MEQCKAEHRRKIAAKYFGEWAGERMETEEEILYYCNKSEGKVSLAKLTCSPVVRQRLIGFEQVLFKVGGTSVRLHCCHSLSIFPVSDWMTITTPCFRLTCDVCPALLQYSNLTGLTH